jgi:hypothetical protein
MTRRAVEPFDWCENTSSPLEMRNRAARVLAFTYECTCALPFAAFASAGNHPLKVGSNS